MIPERERAQFEQGLVGLEFRYTSFQSQCLVKDFFVGNGICIFGLEEYSLDLEPPPRALAAFGNGVFHNLDPSTTFPNTNEVMLWCDPGCKNIAKTSSLCIEPGR